jgi:hypothetical protein
MVALALEIRQSMRYNSLDSAKNAWRFPFSILGDTRQNLFWTWYRPKNGRRLGERVGEDLHACFEINASRLQRLTRTTPRGESSKVDYTYMCWMAEVK